MLTLVIFSLGHKFMSPLESYLDAVAVLLFCVFKQRGNMIFPYGYAALYGTVLGTLALAAQVNHVRFKRRGSLFMAGTLFCCGGLLPAAVFRSPREQRLKNAGLALISVSIFPLKLYSLLLARIPAGAIFKDTFLIPGQIPAETRAQPSGQDLAGVDQCIGCAVRYGRRDRACGSPGDRELDSVRPPGSEPALALVDNRRKLGDLDPFRALSVLSLAMTVYCFFADQDKGDGLHRRQLLIVAVYSLTVLARVIVRVPAGGAYGAGLLPFRSCSSLIWPGPISRFFA